MKIVIPTYKRPDGKIDALENGWIPNKVFNNAIIYQKEQMT